MGRNDKAQREIPRSASIDISGDKAPAFTFRAKDASITEDTHFANFISRLVWEINSHYQSYLDEDKKAQDPYYTERVPHGVQILYDLVNKVSEGIRFTEISPKDQLSYLDETMTRYKIGKELTFFQRWWPFSTEGRRHPETQAFYECVKSEIASLSLYNPSDILKDDKQTQESETLAELLKWALGARTDRVNAVFTHMNWGISLIKIRTGQELNLESSKYRIALEKLSSHDHTLPTLQGPEDYALKHLKVSTELLMNYLLLMRSGVEKNLLVTDKVAMLFELDRHFSLFKELELFKFYLCYWISNKVDTDVLNQKSLIQVIGNLIDDIEELENSIYLDAKVILDDTAQEARNISSPRGAYQIWFGLEEKLAEKSILYYDENLRNIFARIKDRLDSTQDDYKFEKTMREIFIALYSTKFRSLIEPGLKEFIKICEEGLEVKVQGNDFLTQRIAWARMARLEQREILENFVKEDEKKGQGFFKRTTSTSSKPQSKISREALVHQNFVVPRKQKVHESVDKILKKQP